jgi:ABC-type Mn2+/Zn2+ transport system permease subunit
VWGLAPALALTSATRPPRIGAAAPIGVTTPATFALGVALLTFSGNQGPSFDAALFGSIIGVRTVDLWVLAGVCVLTVAVVLLNYRALLFATFDPDVADVSGVRVARTDALLMLVLSLSILATLTIIGVTLVAATLVVPAVVARMLTDSFSRMLWLSSTVGAACGFVGMNLLPPRRALRHDDRADRCGRLLGGPDAHRRARAASRGPGREHRPGAGPRRRPRTLTDRRAPGRTIPRAESAALGAA